MGPSSWGGGMSMPPHPGTTRWRRSGADRRRNDEGARAWAARGALSEPARAARGAELLLLGRVGERRLVALGLGGRTAQEADLHLADEPVAELGVADARALVGRGRRLAGDLR